MKRHVAAALAAACASAAVAQVPPGTYVFISGPGVGTPPFTVSGATTSLGGSVMGAHLPNCAGPHVHGTFNGFPDPLSSTCGHGIISLFVGTPGLIGPGGMPTNVAGQLALTTPSATGLPLSQFGDAFLLGLAGFGLQDDPTRRDSMYVVMNAINRFGDEDGPGVTTQLRIGGALREPAAAPAAPLPANALSTTLADPAQQALTAPGFQSLLDEFAAYDDQSADGYRRDADKTREQSRAWEELADNARADAERNDQRADEARREGREKDAADWEKEAERDRKLAEERDAEARRLKDWSDEAREREDAARRQAQERREAAERAREQARQAERDRAERARQQAEDKARAQQEERDARRAKEAAEREARIRELEDRVRANQERQARERREAQREHERRLADEQARRDQRARGSSSDADLAAAAARKKKQEEEEKSLLDRFAEAVVEVFDTHGDDIKDKGLEALRDEGLKRAGITDVIEEAGLGKASETLGKGIDQLKAVKKLGDSMEAELQRQPRLRERIEGRIDQLSDPRSSTSRPLTSGSLYGSEMFGTVSRMVEANK
jgi:hypothetical protein